MGIETAIIGGIGASALGSRSARKAAKSAAETQAQAAAAANSLEREMWERNREDMSPWLTQGKSSLSQLADLTKPGGSMLRQWTPADLSKDPGYQFRLGEATRGTNRAMAARGLSNSGTALRELSRVNQGMASEEAMNAYNRDMQQRQNVFNMLSGLANTGQIVGQNLGQAGSQFASAYGQNLGQAADARASQYAANAQAKQNMLSDVLGLGMQFGTKKGWF